MKKTAVFKRSGLASGVFRFRLVSSRPIIAWEPRPGLCSSKAVFSSRCCPGIARSGMASGKAEIFLIVNQDMEPGMIRSVIFGAGLNEVSGWWSLSSLGFLGVASPPVRPPELCCLVLLAC